VTVTSLYTSDGRHVGDVLTPPFASPPQLLVWGERFFIRRDDGRYYEALGSWWIVGPDLVQSVGTLAAGTPTSIVPKPCARCGGRGRITVDKGDHEDCPTCRGSGHAP